MDVYFNRSAFMLNYNLSTRLLKSNYWIRSKNLCRFMSHLQAGWACLQKAQNIFHPAQRRHRFLKVKQHLLWKLRSAFWSDYFSSRAELGLWLLQCFPSPHPCFKVAPQFEWEIHCTVYHRRAPMRHLEADLVGKQLMQWVIAEFDTQALEHVVCH